MARRTPKLLSARRSVDQAVKSICDIMRRGNCAGALQYVPELTWILFLRILDELEDKDAAAAAAVGAQFTPSIEAPYRWRDWAAPPDDGVRVAMDGQAKPQGWKRRELWAGASGAFFGFVNGTPDAGGRLQGLLPYLKTLKNRPTATPRQKVISEVLTGVERVRIDTEKNFLDVLDKVHEITAEAVDTTHVFTLSQVYEGLLLKMGEKGNDGGQFFTPREVIRAMVRTIDPKAGETVYDPCCGTGGFLAQTFEYVGKRPGAGTTAGQVEGLKTWTFWGREKENLVYPIALANLVLHGLDRPGLWHGNTLTGQEVYGGLFDGAPAAFDVILTNPPFGGKEGADAQTGFDYRTRATQVLFLQHVIRSLKPKGRCGIVLDEGLLFRTNEDAFVKTKKKLLDDCELWCVVSLPGGVFTAAGAGVKTNLLFFTKGQPTRRIWYYDLSEVKVGKKTPLTLAHFEAFFRLLPARADSEHSWTVDFDARRAAAAEQAKPLKAEAAAREREADTARDRLRALTKAPEPDATAVATAKAELATLTKAAREAAGKAAEIEAAVYDLKAVNPNRKATTDDRSTADLLDLVQEEGRAVTAALAPLRRPAAADLDLAKTILLDRLAGELFEAHNALAVVEGLSSQAETPNASAYRELFGVVQRQAVAALVLTVRRVFEPPNDRNPNWSLPTALLNLRQAIPNVAATAQGCVVQNQPRLTSFLRGVGVQISANDEEAMREIPDRLVTYFETHCPRPGRKPASDLDEALTALRVLGDKRVAHSDRGSVAKLAKTNLDGVRKLLVFARNAEVMLGYGLFGFSLAGPATAADFSSAASEVGRSLLQLLRHTHGG